MFGGAQEKCDACKKTVYFNERLAIDNVIFHTTCFRCEECQCKLKPGNYTALSGKYFCKPHFKALFRLHGNYAEGFGEDKPQQQWAKKGGDSASDVSHERTRSADVSAHKRTQSDVSDSSTVPSEAAHVRRASNFSTADSTVSGAEDLANIRAQLRSTGGSGARLSGLKETEGENGNGHEASNSMAHSDTFASAQTVNALKNRFVESDSPTRATAVSTVSQGSESLKDAPKVSDLKGKFGVTNMEESSPPMQAKQPAVELLRRSSAADSVDSALDSPQGLKLEIESLTASKQMLQDTCSKQSAALEKLQEQVTAGAQERAALAEASTVLEGELRAGRDRLAAIEAEIEIVRGELNAEKDRRSRAESELSQERDRKASGDSELEALNRALQQEKNARATAERKAEDLSNKLKLAEAAASDKHKMADEANDLREERDAFERRLEDMNEQLTQVFHERDELRRKLEEEVKRSSILEIKLEKMEGQADQGQNGNDAAEVSRLLDEAHERNATLMARFNEERERNNELQRQLEAAKNDQARNRSATAGSVGTGRPTSASVASAGRPASASTASSLPSRDDDSHPLAQVRRLRQQVEQMRLQMPKTSARTPRSSNASQRPTTVDGTRRHTAHTAPGEAGTRLSFDDDGVAARTRAKTKGY